MNTAEIRVCSEVEQTLMRQLVLFFVTFKTCQAFVAGEQALYFEWRAKPAARERAWEYEGLAKRRARA